MVEEGQASLVGIVLVNQELHHESHEYTYKCSQIWHKDDALDRYLLGQSVMVAIIDFTVKVSGSQLRICEYQLRGEIIPWFSNLIFKVISIEGNWGERLSHGSPI